MEEEKANLLKYEGEDLIKKLLPVVDTFERAIGMDDTNLQDDVSKFLSGFKMIYGNLNSTLQAYDIHVIDALHQPFDHNTMEAVMTEEVEGIEPNMVIDVLQKGYTYKGKVIRYAMVKVSK
jgi:molecular chaperone GrpE